MQSGSGWGTAFRQLAAGVLITLSLSTAAWAQTPHVKIGLVLSLRRGRRRPSAFRLAIP
ncbi:MAG: hypothetical protein CBARDMAM_3029 [uncultured Caballeronia sp.]|nr:MAG: hypothetical protein CBARDMAM_3029 [uncultured Caballeronia sp.]